MNEILFILILLYSAWMILDIDGGSRINITAIK